MVKAAVIRRRISYLRYLIQAIFLVLIAWSGLQFYRFFQYLADPSLEPVNKPGAVEAFLPISAMLGLRQLVHTGEFDRFHPAALSLFLLILASAWLLRRAFCAWACPVGTVVEAVSALGKRLLSKFGRKPWVPKGWAAYGLSSIKFLLLAFFIWIGFLALNVEQTIAFLATPYNQVVDLKMLLFFIEPGMATVITLVVLAALGLIIPNFWCRFACPYGALLGLIGKLSPAAINRDVPGCNDCGACEKACLNGLKPQKVVSVTSEACTMCLSCVAVCPNKVLGTRIALAPKVELAGPRLSPLRSAYFVAAVVVVVLFGGAGLAQWLGYWQSSLGAEELRQWLPMLRNLSH